MANNDIAGYESLLAIEFAKLVRNRECILDVHGRILPQYAKYEVAYSLLQHKVTSLIVVCFEESAASKQKNFDIMKASILAGDLVEKGDFEKYLQSKNSLY